MKTETEDLQKLQNNDILKEFDSLLKAIIQLNIDETREANGGKLTKDHIDSLKLYIAHEVGKKLINDGIAQTMMYIRIRLGLL